MREPRLWALAALVTGAVLAVGSGSLSIRRAHPRLVRENYAGRGVPATLWTGILVPAAIVAPLITVAHRDAPGLATVRAASWAIAVLAVAGLLDDLTSAGPRGFRGHLAGLARGRLSTGILKLVAGVGMSVLVAAVAGGGPARVAAAGLLMAVATNVVNTLDIVPGRALKWSIVAMVPSVLAGLETPHAMLTAGMLGAALALLPLDLRELGMLGDAGANPLGFVVGFGYAVQLPTPGLLALAASALVLQVLAETVTISRLIEAVPLLRWFDRLGRRR